MHVRSTTQAIEAFTSTQNQSVGQVKQDAAKSTNANVKSEVTLSSAAKTIDQAMNQLSKNIDGDIDQEHVARVKQRLAQEGASAYTSEAIKDKMIGLETEIAKVYGG